MAEDAWGRDAAAGRLAEPALAVAARWWRLRVEGAEHLPAEGPALVVANGGGAQALASLLIARALPRPVYLPSADGLFALPFVGVAARRLGAVGAADVRALLDDGQVVLTFLSGAQDGGRYTVGRFDDAGVAVAAGAPVVPCAVVGPQETGTVPWPVRWRIELGAPIGMQTYGPEGTEGRAALLEAAEAVRDRIQAMVHDNLVRREGAFL